MVKLGGPCQAPGKTEGTICGETEIGDKSDWRRGGKHKPEHAGKWCCPKNKCRIALGVIPDPKAPKAEVAPAPAPAASGPLGGLLDAVSTALARRVWLKKTTPLPVVGVLACFQSVSLPQ